MIEYRGKITNNTGGMKNLSINFFPIRIRIFHLLTEKDEPNPSEIDFKKFILSPKIFLPANSVHFLIGKIE